MPVYCKPNHYVILFQYFINTLGITSELITIVYMTAVRTIKCDSPLRNPYLYRVYLMLSLSISQTFVLVLKLLSVVEQCP